MNNSLYKPLAGIFIACLIAMLWAYQSGYSYSIDWEVTTTGEIIEFPAWSLETDLMTHEIKGEKYLLSEQYAGSEIKRDPIQDQVFLGLMWTGLCVALVASTFLRRYAFFIVVALFVLFLNRLNLFEVGFFGIYSKLITFIPALLLIIPLVIFHEYKKSTPLVTRIITMLILSGGLLLGVQDGIIFTDHLIANSLFGYAICALLFLFMVAEEITFSILYVVTSGKGGKSNHVHFLVLSLIYLGNLTLYYLNKSGLFENSFFFFDPFVLLAISCAVSIWSLKFKAQSLSNYLGQSTLYLLFFSFGIITFIFLTHQMVRGNDAVYQAFHYFILYFHLGFGALFFLYIIGNFIDPLIKGLEIHKIAYKERNFPYASARIGGLMAVLAFYFLSGQEPYNLLKAGYYNYLAIEAETEGELLLSKEYTIQASHLGYNTHQANYTLGWNELKKDAEYPAKTYFFSAAQRYPSPYALINYGNLDAEVNANKVQAIYEESLRKKSNGEVENNLGLLHLQKGDFENALALFEKAKPLNQWNNSPKLNKWNAFKKMELIDSSSLVSDYNNGDFGVKSNILTTQTLSTPLSFSYEGIDKAAYLHRQTYLLNSTYLFTHDSVESLVRKEVATSTDGILNDRLRKALAIHLYNKGEVNEAFMMLDYLQANVHQYYKGEYFDALGKLAMDQGAYKLSIEFFDKALDLKHTQSLFSKLEVLARMGDKDKIPSELLKALKNNPELTASSNVFLERLGKYSNPELQQLTIPSLDSLSDDELIRIGRMNAFHESQVIAVVNELNKREVSGGYELLVDATEINPYSALLLKKYAFMALDWNLTEYADQTLEKLRQLLDRSDFLIFENRYNEYRKELEDTSW